MWSRGPASAVCSRRGGFGRVASSAALSTSWRWRTGELWARLSAPPSATSRSRGARGAAAAWPVSRSPARSRGLSAASTASGPHAVAATLSTRVCSRLGRNPRALRRSRARVGLRGRAVALGSVASRRGRGSRDHKDAIAAPYRRRDARRVSVRGRGSRGAAPTPSTRLKVSNGTPLRNRHVDVIQQVRVVLHRVARRKKDHDLFFFAVPLQERE